MHSNKKQYFLINYSLYTCFFPVVTPVTHRDIRSAKRLHDAVTPAVSSELKRATLLIDRSSVCTNTNVPTNRVKTRGQILSCTLAHTIKCKILQILLSTYFQFVTNNISDHVKATKAHRADVLLLLIINYAFDFNELARNYADCCSKEFMRKISL